MRDKQRCEKRHSGPPLGLPSATCRRVPANCTTGGCDRSSADRESLLFAASIIPTAEIATHPAARPAGRLRNSLLSALAAPPCSLQRSASLTRFTGRVWGTGWGAAGVGHDLTDPYGRRVEVKAVAAGHSTSPAHTANFDALCLVRLNPEDLDVQYAVLMPTDVAMALGRPHARGGITLRATNGLPQRSGVEDLTDVFRAAVTRSCPECGAPFTTGSTEPAEPLLEVVRAHQRIWHDTGAVIV